MTIASLCNPRYDDYYYTILYCIFLCVAIYVFFRILHGVPPLLNISNMRIKKIKMNKFYLIFIVLSHNNNIAFMTGRGPADGFSRGPCKNTFLLHPFILSSIINIKIKPTTNRRVHT